MTGARTRQLRHDEVLSRWPVLNEPWAVRIERSRAVVAVPGGPPVGGVDPLTAINRRMGLPDDYGRDAVQKALTGT
jgi:hypothetical protein